MLGLEAKVIRSGTELLKDPIVTVAASSFINLLKYMNVYLMTRAHMAVDAQLNVEATKEELSKLKANFQGRLEAAERVH